MNLLPVSLKLKISSQRVLPITYGKEIWTLTKSLEEKLNSAHMQVYGVVEAGNNYSIKAKKLYIEIEAKGTGQKRIETFGRGLHREVYWFKLLLLLSRIAILCYQRGNEVAAVQPQPIQDVQSRSLVAGIRHAARDCSTDQQVATAPRM